MKTVITSEYEALFRQHFRLATLYAERIVGSAHEAEDIVQEVFIALLDVDFSQIRQKESYLYRCVRNAALDHLHARMKNRFYTSTRRRRCAWPPKRTPPATNRL